MKSMNRRVMLIAAVAAIAQCGLVHAAPQTWDGGGANNNLSTAGNWVGDVVPAAGDDVTFTGLVRNTPIVDLATQYLSMTFDINAGAFVFGGANAITMGSATPAGGNLTNNSALTQTFNVPVNFYAGTVNAGGAVATNTTGNLVFNGLVNIGNNAATTVTFTGPANTTLAGGITGIGAAGTGGALTKTGTGTLFVTSASSAWAGAVNVNGGALRISNGDALGNGGGIIAMSAAPAGGGTGSGTLELVDNITVAKTVQMNGRGDATVPHLRNISGNNTISQLVGTSGGGFHNIESAGGLLTIGTYTINSAVPSARTIALSGAGNGQIDNWSPANAALAHNLVKNGAGTWSLGSNLAGIGRLGNVTVNGGNLSLGAGVGAIMAGNTVVNTGSTLTVVSSGGVDGELGNNTTPTSIRVVAGATLDASSFSNYSLQVAQTLTLGGTFKAGSLTAYGDNVIYLGDVNTVSPGTGVIQGNLNLSSQFATALGGIHFDLANVTTVGGGVNDLLSVQGALNVDTSSGPISLRLHPIAGLANGTYRLIEFTGGATLNASDFVLTGFASGTTRQSVSVGTAANQVNLVVSGSPANVVWSGANSSAWDVGVTGTNNWLNGGSPDKYFDFDSVSFTDAAANKTVDLTTAITPASITVNSSGDYLFQGGGSLNGSTGITKSGSGKLTIANAGPNNITGTITINGGSIEVGNGGTDGGLGSGAVVNNGTLIYNKSDLVDPGVITGTGALIQRGTGNIVLNDASTYSGATTIEQGVALVSNAGAFGDATSGTTVNSGASIFFVNPATVYTEAFTVSGSGNLGTGAFHTGGAALTTLTGAVNFAGETSVNNDGGSTLLINNSNGITGGGTITKFGAGALQIVGTAHAWTGGVNVGEGTLILGAGADLGAVNGAIIVAGPGGTLAFGSTQASTYTASISGNGIIAAGNTGAVTTLTGDLTGFSGTLSTSTGGVASTLIVNTPTNATTATVASPGGGDGYGVLRLERSDALAAGAIINVQPQQLIGTGRLELANNITIDASAITLNQRNVTGAVGTPAVLTPALASLLTPAISSASGNNTINGPVVLTTGGSFAAFEAAAGATLNVGGTIKPLATAASARQVVFQGAGTGNVSGVISDDTQLINVYKAGTGTWTLSGANSYTGVTRVLAGKLIVGIDAQAPILTNAGGADVLGGTLSLLYTGDGSALANTVRSTLAAGYAQSPAKFATGQIRSTILEANRVLGWADTGTSVDVAYTLPGDTNLDFTVNFDDLLALAQNYNGTSKVWEQGDVNYDTLVNFDDLLALAQNYNGSALEAGTLASAMGEGFASDWTLALSMVPEPTSLSVLAGGLLLTRRRRA